METQQAEVVVAIPFPGIGKWRQAIIERDEDDERLAWIPFHEEDQVGTMLDLEGEGRWVVKYLFEETLTMEAGA